MPARLPHEGVHVLVVPLPEDLRGQLWPLLEQRERPVDPTPLLRGQVVPTRVGRVDELIGRPDDVH
eukprot:841827-Pyramimonas_sp.AAC.1